MTNILRKISWWSGDGNTTTIAKATEILGKEFVCNNTQTLLGSLEPSPLIEPVLYSQKELVKSKAVQEGVEQKTYLVYLHGLSHAKLHNLTHQLTKGAPHFFFLSEFKAPWWLNPDCDHQKWAYEGFESGYYLISLRIIPTQSIGQKLNLRKNVLLPTKIFGHRVWQRMPGNMLAEALFSLYHHFGQRVCEKDTFHIIPAKENMGVELRYEPFDGSLTIITSHLNRPGSGMFTYLPRHKPFWGKA